MVSFAVRSRPSIVSSHEFDFDKDSLLRMLHDFDRDHSQLVGATEPSPLEELIDKFRQAAAEAANNAADAAKSLGRSGDTGSSSGAAADGAASRTSSNTSTSRTADPIKASSTSAAAARGPSNLGVKGSKDGAAADSQIVVPKTAEGILGPADQDAIQAGMQTVMGCYESELKSPIRHLMKGELARTLLIQVRSAI